MFGIALSIQFFLCVKSSHLLSDKKKRKRKRYRTVSLEARSSSTFSDYRICIARQDRRIFSRIILSPAITAIFLRESATSRRLARLRRRCISNANFRNREKMIPGSNGARSRGYRYRGKSAPPAPSSRRRHKLRKRKRRDRRGGSQLSPII